MQQTLIRDGLARIKKWKLEDKHILSPELLFIQAPRLPIPSEARAIITADPTMADTPFIYHRGTLFSKSAPLDKCPSLDNIRNSILAELPPINWKPAGIDSYLKKLGLDLPEVELSETEEGKNVRIIYESYPDEKLKDLSNESELNLVIMGNSLELFNQPRRFVEEVIRIKKHLGPSISFYTPTLGVPQQLALLTYMGIDLFDTLPLIYRSREELLLTASGQINAASVGDDWYCTCRFCSEWQKEGSAGPEFHHILGHNYLITLQELNIVRSSIRSGTLRELVESRMSTEPNAVSLLRHLDSLHYDYYEEFVPVARKTKMNAATIDSLNRPEVKRFQQRIRERFVKPDFAKVLLMLPCSARKPYSQSRSHRAFLSAVKSCKNPTVVHELILTSPLGIVPTELELVYPAQHYDIPVTGFWYEEEKAVVRQQLMWLLDNFEYDYILAHLDDDEKFMVEGFENLEHTSGSRATSDESLDALTKRLNELTEEFPKVSEKERRIQILKTMAMFLFGHEAGLSLMEGAEVKGKYPFWKILFKGQQLGMIEAETGLISLTLAGGERILNTGDHSVEIDEFELKGDIFAPAVINADTQIRPNDEVVVFSKSNGERTLKAVGRAAMTSSEMIEAKKGKAVRVRHFVK